MSFGPLLLAVVTVSGADLAPADTSNGLSFTSHHSIAVDAVGLLTMGRKLEQAGDAEKAIVAYRSLQQDPSANVRAEARFRLAKLAMKRENWTEAALFLRRVLDDRPDAVPARIALAQALAQLGDDGAALRELRAAQAVVLPSEVARMVDRFGDALRIRRPFGASIEIALAPDSNINAATQSGTLGTVIGDFVIDEGSRQQSGMGLALRGQILARRAIGEVGWRARFTGSADLYSKKRFNHVAFDLGVGPEISIGRTRLSVEAGATRHWYGTAIYQDLVRIGADAGRPVTSTTFLRASAGIARVNNHFNDLQDGKSWSASIGVEQALGSRTGVGLSLFGQRDALDDPGYSTRSVRLRALGWQEIGRTTLTLTATLGKLDADETLSLFAERRRERYRAVSLGALFRALTFRDMAPFVRASWEANRSTVGLYDYSRRRFEFGVSRAF